MLGARPKIVGVADASDGGLLFTENRVDLANEINEASGSRKLAGHVSV